MADRLASAREAVRRASDVADDSTVRERLRSIDEGSGEMTEGEWTIADLPFANGVLEVWLVPR